MKLVFRQYMIVLLAMLQMFAPLVHAHTGSHDFSQGLHIPGLETYLSGSQHAPANQAVNLNKADWGSEGFLVVVDAGIKNPYDGITVSQQNDLVLIPYNPFLISSLFENVSNFSPHRQVAFYGQLHSPLSPRAPPH